MLGMPACNLLDGPGPARSTSAWTWSFCSRSWRPSSLRASRFCGVRGLADRLGDFVRLAVQLFDFRCFSRRCSFQFDQPVDVGRDAPIGAILLDQIGVFDDELAIQHDMFPWLMSKNMAGYSPVPSAAPRTRHPASRHTRGGARDETAALRLGDSDSLSAATCRRPESCRAHSTSTRSPGCRDGNRPD